MIPWVQLAAATAPDGAELRLMQRGCEFSIMLGANELMNSRLSGSEEALATLACARLKGRAAPRLLIGGLGMGFTLRAALGALGPQAKIVVAELVPEVAAWARDFMPEVFAGSLDDPRVRLDVQDVVAAIGSSAAEWDAVLLDVDNGPDGLTRPANDRLYSLAGLSRILSTLRPGGVLAVWSSSPHAGFTARLRKCGFGVEEVRVRAHRGKSGARHTIWLATAPG